MNHRIFMAPALGATLIGPALEPLHPSPVLPLETDDNIERIVLPTSAWTGPCDVLQVGRRLRVVGHCEFPPKARSLPVALHVELIDVH